MLVSLFFIAVTSFNLITKFYYETKCNLIFRIRQGKVVALSCLMFISLVSYADI